MERTPFLNASRTTLEWVGEYLTESEPTPVASQARPGELRAALPDSPPVEGETWDSIWSDFQNLILPGITHWQSPNFFAYFPANGCPISVLGEILSTALGVNGMLWATSPAATELETHVLDWLVEMLGLPEAFRGQGVIQDSASSASLLAMLCARERLLGPEGVETGLTYSDRPITVYTSTEAHSSILKAAAILGIGRQNVRFIETDDRYALLPSALEAAIVRDLESGCRPALISATCGTTSSMAFDPLEPIAEIADRHELMLHVDAAMAGSSLVCPEFRDWSRGLERADSFTFNPHKWMMAHFDCNAFFVRDPKLLTRTLSVTPEYLHTDQEEVIDYRDWQIPLGRRFRSLKLWFVLRHYGVEGIRARIRNHVALAGWFADQIREDPRFELAAPPALCLVCFRLRGNDTLNRQLLQTLNASGELFLSHTALADRFVLRMSIGQTRTQRPHVEKAWRQITQTAEAILAKQTPDQSP
ncbi:MAG: pyridoxal-dependent decarboxylase [Planctomycetota bacterium]|jgi:aromatic-L-amino-acid decarboxylase|nr:pyridoxal-dependent decarboxylase [Planctomycetota bacterium]